MFCNFFVEAWELQYFGGQLRCFSGCTKSALDPADRAHHTASSSSPRSEQRQSHRHKTHSIWIIQVDAIYLCLAAVNPPQSQLSGPYPVSHNSVPLLNPS